MRITIARMAQDLIDRIDDYNNDPEPQYEPELEALQPGQIKSIRRSLDTLARGDYPDNPLEGC
jgi:hypothetical protein